MRKRPKTPDRIAGNRMTDTPLYPWSIGSLARALLFYGQAQGHADRRVLGAVAIYYSLFHLGMFLIFACPKHHTSDLRSKIQGRVGSGDDPRQEVSHTAVRNFLQTCVQRGLSRALSDAFVRAQDLRVFINYGPRVYWKGSGDISVDTCEHHNSELAPLRSQLSDIFHDAVRWACTEGADGGIWMPPAIREVRGFFADNARRYYADWCTDEEAHVAESLRASLEEEARRRVFGNTT